MKIKIKFIEINRLIPVMSSMLQVNLPFDISFRLYQTGETLDKANDYFVKKVKEIQETKSDMAENDILELMNTEVELNSELLNWEALCKGLKDSSILLSSYDINLLRKLCIADPLEEEVPFRIMNN